MVDLKVYNFSTILYSGKLLRGSIFMDILLDDHYHFTGLNFTGNYMHSCPLITAYFMGLFYLESFPPSH